MNRPTWGAARRAVPVVALAIALAACAPVSATNTATNTGTVTQADCTPAKLAGLTYAPNTLTLAAELPGIAPWYSTSDPRSGQGYEAATAAAIAQWMGFVHVTWVNQSFDAAIKPGAKPWDADINNVTILPERQKVEDFTVPYYTDYQAVVARVDTPTGKALLGLQSIEGLRGLRSGAEDETTSLAAIKNTIKPDIAPREYPSHDVTVQALRSGAIDYMVTDLPTAYSVAHLQGIAAAVIGRLPGSEQFGMILKKGSPLKPCFDAAITALRANGTLDGFEQQDLQVITDSVPELR